MGYLHELRPVHEPPALHAQADGSPDWPWVIGLITLTAGVVVSYLKIFVFWRATWKCPNVTAIPS